MSEIQEFSQLDALIDLPGEWEGFLQKLGALIHLPTQWARFDAQVDMQGLLPELQQALEALPESSIRAARLARVMLRRGRRDQALAMLSEHKKCNLCKAWFFAIMANTYEDQTLRMLSNSWRPDWQNLQLTDLEAKFRGYLAVGTAATALKRNSLADEMYEKALQIAQALEDHEAWKLVVYNQAMVRLYDNDIQSAHDTFHRLATEPTMNPTLKRMSAEYAAIATWLLGGRLADEFKQLGRLSHKLATLKSLTREFYLMLPLAQVKENRERRSRYVQEVLQPTGSELTGVTGFVEIMCNALANSMDGNTNAINVLETALKLISANIPLLIMAYKATYIQVHANLPHVAKDREVKAAMRVLVMQWKDVPAQQRIWLRWWLREFCPVALYITAQFEESLRGDAASLVVVDDGKAMLDGKRVRRYPVTFMTEHILQILSGKSTPYDQRMQAYRHRDQLSALEKPFVILKPVIEVLQRNQN